jgi:3-deoxy-D-manno-octulosonate 8-phosphate phosphatase (KDO 8-P phosphatase)
MKNFILDVDGVMTNGQFFYDRNGKTHKIFGPDDSDGLKMIKNLINIRFVSADKRGFDISKKRIHDDMGYQIDLIPSKERLDWIDKQFGLNDSIYMGDGFFDNLIMREVAYSIAPYNADQNAKDAADYITTRSGGDRAVAEACVHIYNKFFSKQS